jgi:hypothetical protein
MVRGPCLVCGLTPHSGSDRPRVEFHHAFGYAKADRLRGLWLCRDREHGHPKADRDSAYNAELIRLDEISKMGGR